MSRTSSISPTGNSRGGISTEKFQRIVSDLNRTIETASPDSAAFGFEVLAGACAALLDIYAMPNENNTQGMCDDPHDFRDWFCSRIMGAPNAKVRDPRRKD